MQALNLGYRVAPAIDQWLDENPEYRWTFTMEPKIGDDAWHPSGSCTPTVRELWETATGVAKERPLTVSLKKTFGVGHYYHQWIQTILRDKLKWCTSENVERRGGRHWDPNPEFHCHDYWDSPKAAWGLFQSEERDECGQRGLLKPAPYHWATGSADVAPLKLVDGTLVLFDIKSISSTDARSDAPPARYVDKWECQASIYMDWFPECEEAIFFGVSKDSPHGFREWVFKPNPDLVDAIYKKWMFVSEALDLDEEILLSDNEYFEPLPLQGSLSR
jgi:hypothetical protein